jgi:hypothetical protein
MKRVVLGLGLVAVAVAGVGACQQVDPSSALVVEPAVHGHLETPLGDGPTLDGEKHGVWTYHYPTGAALATGAYYHGRKVGEWAYWYSHGQLLLRGTYGEELRLDGAWIMLDPSGEPVTEKSWFGCSEDDPLHALAMHPAGRDLFEWSLFEADSTPELNGILPFFPELWDGSGYYSLAWKRPLSAEEQEALTEAVTDGGSHR